MKVIMEDFGRADSLMKKAEPLVLTEVKFKINPDIKERKRLFRNPLYELTIIAEVNDQILEFEGTDLNQRVISQLEKDPSRFLVGDEPFFCGTNWPNSGIAEVVKLNNVPSDSLIITDGERVIATIDKDEIPSLIEWYKNLSN